MQHEHVSFMLAMTLFAVGAVAVIIYQHTAATQQIVGLLGGGSGGSQAGAGGMLGSPVSLAGTPTIGQTGSSQAPPIVPLSINQGYVLS